MAIKCYGLVEDKSMPNISEEILWQKDRANGSRNSLGLGFHSCHTLSLWESKFIVLLSERRTRSD